MRFNIRAIFSVFFFILTVGMYAGNFTLTYTVQDVSCYDGSDGSITVNVHPATPGDYKPPYTYSWYRDIGDLIITEVADTTATLSNIKAGSTYLVLVKDNDGIQRALLNIVVSQPNAITLSSSITDITCFGGSDGAIDITVGEGTPPYSYGWVDGTGSGSIDGIDNQTGLTAGTYYVTITDSKSCVFGDTLTVGGPTSGVSGGIASITHVACFGDATGSVTVAGSGGIPPYEYSLDGGAYQSSGTFNNLPASSYTVTVKDDNDCTSDVPVTITQPGSAVTGSIFSQTDVLCFGESTGSVTVTGSGGSPPYEYSKDGGGYQASGTFTNLAATSYTITVRDNNNCTFDVPVTITEPATSVSGSITSQTDVACFGGSTGSVTVAGAGGTPGYDYSLDGGPYQGSGTFGTLSAGNFTVTVRDANLCTFDVPVTITQPASAVSGSIISQTIACFGQSTASATASGSGGTPPYEYSLDGGPYQPSGTFSTLSAGSYTITVRDASLCTFNIPLTITEAATALSGSISSQTDVACFGESTGAVTVSGSGGTTPYEYSWDGGAYQASGTFSSLLAGNYTVTVQDANLCTFDVPVTITEPGSAVSGSISSQTDVLCFGESTGSVTVAGSGGTPSYNYSLDGGPYQTSGTYGGLAAGNYNVTVRDANLCTFLVPVTITQPATGLSGSIADQTNVLCFGDASGSVTIAASGGNLPYEYSLNGGAYQASGTFNGLLSGSHTVTIQDANLCTFNVPVSISQPSSSLSGNISGQTNVLCFGESTGIVTVAGSGGTPTYEYSLDGGAYQASGTYGTLAQGSYLVTVRDANLCTFDVPVTITEPASAVSGNITSLTDVACFGESTGSVTISGSGGTPTYEYSLDGGAYQVSGTFNSLATGNYTVTVRDANLCTIDVPVFISQPASALSGNITSQTNVACEGDATGSVTIVGTGGSPPYQYSFDGNPFQGSGTFGGLTFGNYIVTVQDNNLCTFDVPVTITEPTAIGIATLDFTGVRCAGDINGTITVSATGGFPGYVYTLKKGVAVVASNWHGSFINLVPGTDYTVEITDTLGCGPFISNQITISEPLALVINSETPYDITCNGANDGRIDVVASGGTAPYMYSNNNGVSFVNNGGNFTGLSPNSFTIVVKDTMGCTITGNTFILDQPNALNLVVDTTKATCNNVTADGSMRLSVNGGTPVYEYSIDNGLNYQVDSSFNGLLAGIYDVVIKDNNNCLLNQTVEIESKYTVTAYAGEDTSVCPGTSYTLYASGGDTYLWSSFEVISDPTNDTIVVSPTSITRYFLTASRDLCEDTDSVTIALYPVYGIDAGNDTTAQPGGSVVLTASIGFASYLWLPAEFMSNPSGSSITVTPLDNMYVYVTGTTSDGCLETDSLQLFIAQNLVIPSGFTPNNDGVNDTWEITNSYLYPHMTVDIFTRWGAKIFHSKGYNADNYWEGTRNGKDMPMGTYYYVIHLNDPFGTKPITGPVTIIR